MSHPSTLAFPFAAELTESYTDQHSEAIVGLDVSVTGYSADRVTSTGNTVNDTPHTYEATFTEVGGSQAVITLEGVSPLHLDHA